MKRILPPAALALAALLPGAPPALAAPRTVTVAETPFGPLQVVAPQEEPNAFVFVIAKKDGIAGDRADEIEDFVENGAAVAAVTPEEVVAAARAETGDCFYLFGAIEEISHEAQRQLGAEHYRLPVIVGAGTTGGTFAYLSIAGAPDNSGAGAVALDVDLHALDTGKSICGSAEATEKKPGVFDYKPASDLPGALTLILGADPNPMQKSVLDADTAAALKVEAGADDRLDDVLSAAQAMSEAASTEVGDLPIVELPAPKARTLGIFLSGDGGWRDIDKDIAEELNRNDIAIVGLDSLRYFWTQKSPADIARDISHIADTYSKRWKTTRVALLGFSFGADVIPFAWPRVTPDMQSATDLVALLSIDDMASFQISVSSFIGAESATDRPLRPLLARLPKSRTMCFFGADEKADGETACTAPELTGASIVERPGGHHFDGDYQAIARLILARLQH
jgi:type IV secretory pathway VirJ component